MNFIQYRKIKKYHGEFINNYQQMQEKSLQVTTGAWGWQHKVWENDVFYPADLPQEWQLTYYANEFSVVVVPASYWLETSFSTEDWHDDVPENFVFYIDWPFAALKNLRDYQLCADECRLLAAKLGAVLVDQLQWEELDSEQKNWFEQVTAKFSVLFYNGAGASSGYAVVADDHVEVTTAPLILLHSQTSENLRELGQRLKPLLEQSQCQTVILGGDQPAMSRLKEIKTLLELLGF